MKKLKKTNTFAGLKTPKTNNLNNLMFYVLKVLLLVNVY